MKKLLVFISSLLALMATSSIACTDCQYSGAEVATKVDYKYGRFEMRTKAIGISGAVSSMFAYYNDSYIADTMWNEIDIEFLGKNSYDFQSNIITGTTVENPAKKMSEIHHTLEFDASQEYHDYAFEWTPTYIAWFLDGVQIRKVTKDSNDTKEQIADFDERRMDLRFNMWIADIVGWVGSFDDADLPACAYYDWFKYSAYTPGAGDNGSDFTTNFEDTFDGTSLDYTNWKVSTHSFDENLVMFDKFNVKITNSNMALCLTDRDQTGMDDLIAANFSTNTVIQKEIPNLGINFIDGHLYFNENLNVNTQLKIYDLNGNLVQANNITKEIKEIKLNQLSSGVYTVKISNYKAANFVIQ